MVHDHGNQLLCLRCPGRGPASGITGEARPHHQITRAHSRGAAPKWHWSLRRRVLRSGRHLVMIADLSRAPVGAFSPEGAFSPHDPVKAPVCEKPPTGTARRPRVSVIRGGRGLGCGPVIRGGAGERRAGRAGSLVSAAGPHSRPGQGQPWVRSAIACGGAAMTRCWPKPLNVTDTFAT